MGNKKQTNIDLLAIIAYIILTAAYTLIPPLNETAIRTILGIPMIIFIPGYAFVTLLFPRKDDISGIERIALSIGLSIVIIPFIGLGLNYGQWGIKTEPVIIAITTFTLILCVLAIGKRSLLPDDEKYSIDLKTAVSSLSRPFSLENNTQTEKVVNIIHYVLIISCIIGLIAIIVIPPQTEKFTEFYIKDQDGLFGSYPQSLEPGENITVIVGIVNQEQTNIDYTLDVKLDNQSIDLPDSLRSLQLGQNETRENKIIIEPAATESYSKLEFLLYKNNDLTEPYRKLYLWLNVSEGNDGN